MLTWNQFRARLKGGGCNQKTASLLYQRYKLGLIREEDVRPSLCQEDITSVNLLETLPPRLSMR